MVVWVLAALVAAAVLTPVWLIAATGAQAANHGLPPAAVHAGMRQVVVRPGQTLWSIALTAEPAADPRVVTQEIMQVNALSSQVLVPGESLWVPARLTASRHCRGGTRARDWWLTPVQAAAGNLPGRRVGACTRYGVCSTVTTTYSSYIAVVHAQVVVAVAAFRVARRWR